MTNERLCIIARSVAQIRAAKTGAPEGLLYDALQAAAYRVRDEMAREGTPLSDRKKAKERLIDAIERACWQAENAYLRPVA